MTVAQHVPNRLPGAIHKRALGLKQQDLSTGSTSLSDETR